MDMKKTGIGFRDFWAHSSVSESGNLKLGVVGFFGEAFKGDSTTATLSRSTCPRTEELPENDRVTESDVEFQLQPN